MDVNTLDTKPLFNLYDELKEPKGSKPHFKSGFTRHGKVVVCNNSYSTKDYNKDWSAGRLAEWDGKVWKIIEEKSYTEVWSSSHFGAPILATGWDNASAVMSVFFRIQRNGRGIVCQNPVRHSMRRVVRSGCVFAKLKQNVQ